MTQNNVLTIFLIIMSLFFVFGMIGDRYTENKRNYAISYVATIIAMVLINLF